VTASLIGFAAALALCLLRLPIALSLGIVGFVGFGLLIGWEASLAQVAQVTSDTALEYGFSVVPLFVLMGNLVTRAKLSDELYAASNAFLGHRRGGLAYATILACGGFSAVCGSSVATAATMTNVAMPSMRRFGYRDELAVGSIAAGGTLGILIPPSIVLVIYGLLTQSSIGKLFAAGFVPGVVAILFYSAAIFVTTRLSPEAGPPGDRQSWAVRWASLRGVWGVLLLFTVVMGGIYLGIFTPTESAGIGAVGAFLFVISRRATDAPGLIDVLADTAYTTAALFSVLIGALLFANFVNTAGMTQQLAEFVSKLQMSPYAVIWVILLIYIILGCVFESISMVLLTVPVFFPLVQSLGFDLIWFGIVVVCVTELSLITPPVGLNIFVVRGLLPDVPTAAIIRGLFPFIVADVLRLVVIVHIPWLSLVLPTALFG